MKKVFLIFWSLLSTHFLIAQGCSDAGFCTAGSLKPSGQSDSIKNVLGFTLGFAVGEQGTTYLTPQFEPSIKVSEKSQIQIKIPAHIIKGELGNNSGLGDVILTYNYQWKTLKKWNTPVSFVIGTRIATGTSSFNKDNIGLPMPYQLSLGTTDLIVGAKLNFAGSWSVSLGIQNPIFNRNQNGFDSLAFQTLAKNKNLKDEENYFLSANLKRKGDLMLRIDKQFKIKHTMINLGFLPIYHLGNDEADQKKSNSMALKGSAGLTLNFNTSVYYKINPRLEIMATAATPLIVRESRPDGLTRALVLLSGLYYTL